ncbi:hypothetical protein RKD18_005984 [Streptomyces phaeoluteigriseus]
MICCDVLPALPIFQTTSRSHPVPIGHSRADTGSACPLTEMPAVLIASLPSPVTTRLSVAPRRVVAL